MGQRQGYKITTIFKFLSFPAVFTQSKVQLSDGIDRKSTLKNQLSNSFPTSAQYFLRMNTDSWINWTILILLPLNTRINYEQLFQDLQMKYVSKFVGRNLSARKNAHKHSTFMKVTVMQIEKALMNDRLRVSKISWKFRIPTIYNFAVIYPWNLQFS